MKEKELPESQRSLAFDLKATPDPLLQKKKLHKRRAVCDPQGKEIKKKKGRSRETKKALRGERGYRPCGGNLAMDLMLRVDKEAVESLQRRRPGRAWLVSL